MQEVVTDLDVLRKPSEQVIESELSDLFERLKNAINALGSRAVGLSAVQIGVHRRAFVIKYQGELLRFCNPRLLSAKYAKIYEESCLSIPGVNFRVARFDRITIIDDINGEKQYKNRLAQIIQHEMDHLDGLTLLETGEPIVVIPPMKG